MTNRWVGTGYAGEAMARFTKTNDLRPVLVMMSRSAKNLVDDDLETTNYELDDSYGEWWGYLRYHADDNDDWVTQPDQGDELTIEPEERLPLRPRHGWPGKPTVVHIVESRRWGRGFEALIREYVEAGD